MTPELVKAADENNFEKVRALLNTGADVNEQDSDGHTALLYAIYVRNLQMAELLIMSGADANIANKYGRTPLMVAAELGDENLIKLLLDNHADVNKKENFGYTALHIAIWCAPFGDGPKGCEGFIKIIEALLEAGADITIRNKEGKKPIDKVDPYAPWAKEEVEALFNKPRKSTKDRP